MSKNFSNILQKSFNGYFISLPLGSKQSGSNLQGKDNIRMAVAIVMKFNEHRIKVVRRLCGMLTVDEMQLGFRPERGTIDGVLILTRL